MILRKSYFHVVLIALVGLMVFGCSLTRVEAPVNPAPASPAAATAAPASPVVPTDTPDTDPKTGHWEGQAVYGANRLHVSFDVPAAGKIKTLDVQYGMKAADMCTFTVSQVPLDVEGGFDQALQAADLAQAVGLDGQISGTFKDAATLEGKLTLKMCGRTAYYTANDLPITVKWVTSEIAPQPTVPPPTYTPTHTLTPTITLTPAQPFAIRDEAFEANVPEECTTDAKINKVDGESVSASGTITYRNGGFAFWCYGAKHAWIGKLTFAGHTFDSDPNDPLTFMIDQFQGYVYYSGVGTVTLPDGTEVQLPRDGASAGGAQPASTPEAAEAPTTAPTEAAPPADPLQATMDAAMATIDAAQATTGASQATIDAAQATTGAATPAEPPEGGVYLGSIKPQSFGLGYGRFSVGKFQFKSPDRADKVDVGTPILLGGEPSPHGIFAHAPARIVYQLDGKYSQFAATFGLIEWIACGDGVVFIVQADGKEVFRSETMFAETPPQPIKVSIANAQKLLLITLKNDSFDCDWAVWGEARVR